MQVVGNGGESGTQAGVADFEIERLGVRPLNVIVEFELDQQCERVDLLIRIHMICLVDVL